MGVSITVSPLLSYIHFSLLSEVIPSAITNIRNVVVKQPIGTLADFSLVL